MKIKQLDIAGFRSLKNVSWQPGDLNVVIGQNGTGKSNLLRMLELIAAAAEGRLAKCIQAMGGVHAILWDGVASIINFHIHTDGYPFRVSPDVEGFGPNDYEVSLDCVGQRYYWVEREVLGHSLSSGASPKYLKKYLERSHDRYTIFDGTVEHEQSTDEISQEETLLSLAKHDIGRQTWWGHMLTTSFRRTIAGAAIYHDLNVGQDAKLRQAAVARFEKQLDADGQNLVPVLHTLYSGDREFKRNIDSAMRAAFGGDYEELVFPPAADQRVQLRVRWKTLQREQSAADLSDGTLRYLLLLTVLIAPDSPMLIAIDEPEAGLHPTMLPIIAEFAVEASSRTQVVFTTHSPQFLDAFRDTKPTTTVARWKNGETLLNTLDGEELKYWLAEYSLGELFRSGELEALTT